MALIVMKFGGTSVRDTKRIYNAAGIAARTFNNGDDVVMVVSAQGDTTDMLLEKAEEITRAPSLREMDVLLSSGEQQSMALMAMALGELGVPAVSLTGWQAGFQTNRAYGSARIKNLDTERLAAELDKRRIVVVAGFQGINRYDDITTLGRGGSDTSAVAIAAALNADRCQIYTDVDGIYTADPRIVPSAKKLQAISFDEMLELATLGAQVLNNRSVELAKKYGVELEVLSSISPAGGTIVREVLEMNEGMLIQGVAKDTKVAVVTILDVPDVPGVSFKIFSLVGQKRINVDIILQATGREGNKDIIFTVPAADADTVRGLLAENLPRFGGRDVSVTTDVAKVSIVGAGMQSHPGVAARLFEALADENINIRMVSTSEIKISVIIDAADADRAVRAIHDAFMEDVGR
ncbi:MAG: aspartate kinase [Ruminococcaceae bacterium]|nr:aspartate kinase [Oscillospiraceae bacterium]